jgi:hypothetical protein
MARQGVSRNLWDNNMISQAIIMVMAYIHPTSATRYPVLALNGITLLE